uniref:ABC transporter B family member 9 n=1 Tax=Rhizophora mucronata TaxID=61149 RepID=A0A2P2MZ80_RHIMU
MSKIMPMPIYSNARNWECFASSLGGSKSILIIEESKRLNTG